MGLIKLDVAGREVQPIVVDYSVQSDITPLAPGDSSGSVGAIEVSVVTDTDGPMNARTSGILDMDVILTDQEEIMYSPYRGRGSVRGHVIKNDQQGPVTRLTAETLLYRLNVDREADAYYGRRVTTDLITYVINLATNPSLETATTNWAAVAGTGGTAAFTRSNATYPAFSGSYHGRVTWTVAATGVGGATYTQTNVQSGETLYAKMHAQVGSGTQIMRLSLDWRNASNVNISTTNGSPTAVGSTYTELSVSGVAPVGTSYVIVTAYNYDDGSPQFQNWAAGDILIVDATLITTEPSGYFDGSSTDASWTATPNASTSQLTVHTPRDEGYDATIGNVVRYYCGLVGIPNTSVQVDSLFDTLPVAYPGWTGNVWNHLKMLCAAVGAEIVLRDDIVVFRAPRQRIALIENNGSIQRSVDLGGTAGSVDVTNYDSHWGIDELVYESDSIVSVALNETRVVRVKIPHFIDKVNNPLGTGTMNLEYGGGLGEYAILDSDGTPVNTDEWENAGGSVQVSLIDATNIEILITGPGIRVAGTTQPYRLAANILGAVDERPGLRITGSGVFTNKKVVSIATGASETQTSRTQAASVDNPFITNREIAYDRGILTALNAGGPNVSISGFITYDSETTGRDFSDFIGARIYFESAYYRVTRANMTSTGIDFTADADTLFSDAVAAYSVTFDEHNAIHIGEDFDDHNSEYLSTDTFDDVSSMDPTLTFDDINEIYEGMTFNDHAIHPLLTSKPGVTTYAESGL